MGLILGGVITEFASWRWCLLVNTPIALLAAVAAVRLIPESRVSGHTRYDVPGALTSTLGMVTLVYAATKASTDGWGSSSTLALFGVAAVLLVAFVVIEQFSSHPLLPLRVVTERNRGGSYLATFLLGLGLFGSFLFLTYYLQETLHYSALKTGLAFLPFSVGIVAGALLSSRLILRVRPRFIMSTGIVLAMLAVLRFSQLGVHSEYWAHLFPPLLVMAFAMGLVFVPANNTALNGIASADAGVASALINATPQVAVSIGTAVTNTIAATVTANYLRTHSGARDLVAEATVHGFSVAFLVGAAILVLALATVLLFINAPAGAGAREFSDADEDGAGRPAEGQAPSTLVAAPAPT
jgi:predicted MFS family arabinose efflux permease